MGKDNCKFSINIVDISKYLEAKQNAKAKLVPPPGMMANLVSTTPILAALAVNETKLES